MKRANDLTEKEREWFTYIFYQKIDAALPDGLSLDDMDSPRPWGCPWLFEENGFLIGDTIEEMVDSYIDYEKDEIAIVLQSEKEEKET